MKIIINGTFGWGNCGDEAMLQAVSDHFRDHDITVGTNLPFTLWGKYRENAHIKNIISTRDTLTDFDMHLCVPGGVSYDLPWRQLVAAKARNKKIAVLGLGMEAGDMPLNDSNAAAVHEFLSLPALLTVRSAYSYSLLEHIGVQAKLTMDVAYNLECEEWDCPEGCVLACPRFPDRDSVDAVVDAFVSQLKDEDNVLFLPFTSYNVTGEMVDLHIYNRIRQKLPNLKCIFDDEFAALTKIAYNPKRVKYLISRASRIITNGRYHAILFAIAEGIPYELLPASPYLKCDTLVDMDKRYGCEGLKRMCDLNFKLLDELCMR